MVDNLPDLDVSKVKRALGHCRRRDTALDIGAHVGATALAMARQFRRVVAFEAIPDTFAVLKRNTADTIVEAVNLAVTRDHGAVALEFLPKHSQLAHVLNNGEERFFAPQGSVVVGRIVAVPIDSFAFDKVDLIKIDVEGTELDVLQGAKDTILRCKGVRNEGAAFLEGLGMVRLLPFPYNDDWLYGFQ